MKSYTSGFQSNTVAANSLRSILNGKYEENNRNHPCISRQQLEWWRQRTCLNEVIQRSGARMHRIGHLAFTATCRSNRDIDVAYLDVDQEREL